MWKNCLICKKLFYRRTHGSKRIPKYCSKKCQYKRVFSPISEKHKKLLIKINTGNHYAKGLSRKKVENFRKCQTCEKDFYKRSHGQRVRPKYCSWKCRSNVHKYRKRPEISGNKHPFWKGGITLLNEKLRKSFEYKDWRRKVFERDNYTCQICFIRGGILQADHIKPWSLFPKLRFVVSNGRSLHPHCHLKTDTWGWRVYHYAQNIRR